ncbi:MAG: L,D-transpeptidase family protein [Ilumatobacteraceae bacterium]
MALAASVIVPSAAVHAQEAPPDDSTTTTAVETTTTTTTMRVAPPTCRISSPVGLGTTGPEAACVEQALVALGYELAGPDEEFDAASVEALETFQTVNGLPIDGIAGPATAARLGIWEEPPTTIAAPTTTVPVTTTTTTAPVTTTTTTTTTTLPPTTTTKPAPTTKAAAPPTSAVAAPATTTSATSTVTAAPARTAAATSAAPAVSAERTVAATASSGVSCRISTSVRLGTNGPSAECVDRAMIAIGYTMMSPVDAYFDADDVSYVKWYQGGNGLVADGVVGPVTGGRLGIWENGSASPPSPSPAPGASSLPANSGSGRRVVYSRSQQRVWAVDSGGTVVKTHRVSGRTYEPYAGTYSVYSRSMYSYSSANPDIKFRYMVRFAYGPNGGRIGFHEIPTKFGVPIQSESQLGQPLSGGCVRQSTADAQWMWNWAANGTKVVVL